MHLNGGKLSECHLKGKILWEWVNGLKIYDSEKMDPRGSSPPPWGNIHVHVYYHNIQRSFSLKPLGQLKPNFM